ncbi:MAG: 30S ribosomal protein S9 [Chitinophagaceae bacterium]
MENQKSGLGRRKEAIARVYMSKGTGKIVVNEMPYDIYFSLAYLQNQVVLPLKVLELTEAFDIIINVQGGGIKGQAEAIKLGISRALLKINPEYRPSLKSEGFLTRDPRGVERKKFGQKKARKRFQFSKR